MSNNSRPGSSIDGQKQSIRTEILARRDLLSTEDRIDGSLQAATNLNTVDAFSTDKFLPGTIVAGFHPIRSEIDPRPMMSALAQMGARLCLPVVIDKITIEFRELTKDTQLVSSGFGTVGPPPSSRVMDPQILLIPLSAFDRFGGRIGYGAGFYDRAISKLQQLNKGSHWPFLCGVAFSVQEADKVPMDGHDQFLDCVITECAAINCKQNRR